MEMSPSSRSSSIKALGFPQLFHHGRSKNSSTATSDIMSNYAETTDSRQTTGTGTGTAHRLRAQIEKGLEKLKGGMDDGESSVMSAESGESSGFYNGANDIGVGDGACASKREHGKGWSKLTPLHRPQRMKSKRRRKRESEAEEVERGRSVADRGTLQNSFDADEEYRFTRPHFERSGSSLMTVESDVDALATPPALSRSHPSHIGYLTTSSPLVRTINEPVAQVDGPATRASTRASTFPRESNALASTEDSQVPRELLSPSETPKARSPSPVGRLAAALKPRRGSSPSTSPERPKSGGRGGGFGKDKDGGGGSSRRGTVAAKIGNLLSDIQTSNSTTTSSPDSPSSIEATAAAIDTLPQTPPNAEHPAPVIVNTPPTPIDHKTPEFPFKPQPKEQPKISPAIAAYSNIVTSPSGNMISHRRLRSGSGTLVPSKLSNITSAPLTPTQESSTPPTGFFSGIWSAAQTATNTLTNSIGNATLTKDQARGRSVNQDIQVDGTDVEVEISSEQVTTPGEAAEEKEPAVKTLGMGDLSLSQLGITETTSAATTPTASKFPEMQDSRGRSGTADSASARPGTSNTMGDSLGNGSVQAEDFQSGAIREASTFPALGSQTPPNGSIFEGKGAIHRSGSVRSALGAARRKRGSSAATGHTSLGTIGAAIAAANSSLANPASGAPVPKLTGFAVASRKRNKDFHQLFRSVPEDDLLLEDYSCALQREILAHGRLYVSEGHLCFSSNIMGWVNTLVMSFDEIVSVEKRSTAFVFKNGLMISTLHNKHIFASFTSRDLTYDLIVSIWKLGQPRLTSSLNGVRINETGGDKTERDDGTASQDGSNSEEESDDGDDVYDEDDDAMSFTQAGEGSVAGSEADEAILSRKASATVVSGDKAGPASGEPQDFPGPATHAPTVCTDQDHHYDRPMLDEVIPAPLGKIYGLLFGPSSSAWMSRWLSVDQKCLELVMEDKKGLSDENKSRNYSYIKPLNGAIGPKSTKCITTETLDFMDLERSVSVTMSTQTPDVPSGNVFLTKTRYCLMWAEGGGTRLVVTCTIEWSGKSWLKGPIEKGCNDGQIQYSKDLVTGLKVAVGTKPKSNGSVPIPKGGKKSRRKGQKSADDSTGPPGGEGSSVSVAATKSSGWGFLEPLHDLLSPITDIIRPLLSGNILYGLLVGLLVLTWFRYGPSSGTGSSSLDLGLGYRSAFLASPERIAAYEEIWRREESELWEWLEERVGMERMVMANGAGQAASAGRRSSADSKIFGEKLAEEVGAGVAEKDIEDAIRVTEEKLRALKGAVERKKRGSDEGAQGARVVRKADISKEEEKHEL